MGDDLEENFQLSGDEKEEEDEEITLKFENKKRKAEEPVETNSKKKKPNKKAPVPQDVSNMSASAQAEYFWKKYVRAFPTENLSHLEQDKLLNEKHFVKVDFKEPRTDAKNITKFLRKLDSKWIDGLKDQGKGAPDALLICMSTERAQEHFGALCKMGNKIQIAKSWSKQMKIENQIDFLKENLVHIAVGTPNRITKLIEGGSMSTKNLKYVIIDTSFKSIKNFNIFDQFDTQVDLFTLYKFQLQQIITAKPQCKIVLF